MELGGLGFAFGVCDLHGTYLKLKRDSATAASLLLGTPRGWHL